MLQNIKQRILCGLVLCEQRLSFVILTHLELFFPITCQRKSLSTVSSCHSPVSRLIKEIPWKGDGKRDWRVGVYRLAFGSTSPPPRPYHILFISYIPFKFTVTTEMATLLFVVAVFSCYHATLDPLEGSVA